MNVVMPQLGETVEAGTVAQWFKAPGDRVEKNEPLLEVDTDKVTAEVPSLMAGTLVEILVQEGETVAVGTVLAVIASEDEAGEGEAGEGQDLASAPREEAPAPARAAAVVAAARDGARKLSPAVRRLLSEHQLEIDEIPGTGADGRVTRKDVLAYLETRGAAAGDAGKLEPFSKIRKRTAEHMLRSQATSPHVLQAVEADFSAVDAARTSQGDAWKTAEGFSLTYLPFVARAVCLVIGDFPRLNASVEGEALRLHPAVHLAIAVDLSLEGLVAPVLVDAGAKSLADLARGIQALAKKARDGKLAPDDLAGGTYTISNSGSFGTLITAPIINQPQVAILSTDGVRKKPVVVERDGRDDIVARPVGVLAQSFDHRAVDGAYSAAYLRRLREVIETRDWTEELGRS